MYKIRDEIKNEQKHTYAVGDMSVPDGVVDCSAGFNPYGASHMALEALGGFEPIQANEYPHGSHLERAIEEYWGAYARIESANILLTNGSIGGIYLVNCAFSRPGASVLAFSPHFSDYSAHAKFMGIEYRGIKLLPENDYRIDVESMLDKIDSTLSLIYIDNPNNPTGQMLSPDDMRPILDKAKKYGVCVIVDEAYGDFMEQGMSAVTLLRDYDNLIVLRTFSKGMGLAGLRAGYAIASKQMCSMLTNISNPYNVSAPARIAAVGALKDSDFISDCRKSIAKSKASLREALGKNLRMSVTLDTCPIVLLSHVDTSVDLAAQLKKLGILTYSGADFDGLGKNSVRLRVPHPRECEAVREAICKMG